MISAVHGTAIGYSKIRRFGQAFKGFRGRSGYVPDYKNGSWGFRLEEAGYSASVLVQALICVVCYLREMMWFGCSRLLHAALQLMTTDG